MYMLAMPATKLTVCAAITTAVSVYMNDQIDYIWCKLLESAKAPETDVLRVQDFLNLARYLNNPVVVVEEDLLHTLIPG
jgi:hypothetical protein